MRTFHIGGTASRVPSSRRSRRKHAGTVRFQGLQVVEAKDGEHAGELVVMNRSGSLVVQDAKGRDRERYPIVYGARLKVKDGQQVEQGQMLVEWDPYTFSILTEEPGRSGSRTSSTASRSRGSRRGHRPVAAHHRRLAGREEAAGDRDQATRTARSTRKYHMPSHAHLMVQDGETVSAGDVLAKIPRETTKTKDITGGLPRVVELFEARKPRETAVISEIDGIVKHGGIVKGQRKIIIVPDEPGAEPREYSLPRGVHVNVQEGERVRAGEPLMDGPSNPHDILKVLGEKALQAYLVNEIQEVYRLQGVNINDKHIEVIVRQMMRWVKIEDVGDTEFLIDEQVDKFRFLEENERVIANGGRPATGPAAAARHHQGVALDRLVHLGGVVPGNDARAHRGVDLRQGRSPARPEGERDDGPADSGGHRASSTTGTCGSRRTSRRRRRRRRRRSSSWSARWSTSWSRKRRSRGTRSSNGCWRLATGCSKLCCPALAGPIEGDGRMIIALFLCLLPMARCRADATALGKMTSS